MSGAFIWYELMTDDVAGAAAFYRRVLGWSAVDSGLPGPGYRYLRFGGADIGGLMALPEAARAAGAKPGWFPYLQVADVEASAAAIAADGGRAYGPAADVPGVGRFAMLSDPQGGSFYVMAPRGAGESTSFSPGRSGHAGWNELHAADADAARGFYARHFRWRDAGTIDLGDAGSALAFGAAAGGDAPLGAIVADDGARPAWWQCGFNVDDVDAASRRLRAAGGTALEGLRRMPGDVWLLPARDPQGARFALLGPSWGD